MDNNITKDIRYVGVDDHEIDLFEGLYDVPNGMAYNSYVILDEKTAVMDTVEAKFTEQWLANLDAALNGRTPDYLVVHHVEPDHSASILAFAARYPDAVVVASAQAFRLIAAFYGTDFAARRLVVVQGTELALGAHTLTFYTAPMIHWPEVVMSYESTDKVLFSADAFGKFGALDYDDPEGWACEARRYYFGIVGKFGSQVQTLLQKLSGLDVQIICALHGPVLREQIDYYFDTYRTWSSYGVESDGVVIAYTSVYGHTAAAAAYLAEKLEERGCPKVVLTDLARSDMAENVEDAFRYGKLVLAATTYNAGVFPTMKTFIENLVERNYQNRTVAFIENGSWAPMAAKGMREMLANAKDITFAENGVRILAAMNDDTRRQLDALAAELCG